MTSKRPVDEALTAMLQAADARHQAGRLDEAKALYQGIVREHPDCLPAHYRLGNLLHQQNRFEAAVACYRETLRLSPDFAEAHNNLGYSLRKQGADHYAAALEHYNRAIELNSELAEAYMYRGVLHGLLGDGPRPWPITRLLWGSIVSSPKSFRPR